MERLKKIRDIDSDTMFVGRSEHNGDFLWFPVVMVEYTDDFNYDNDPKMPKYEVSLKVVSPEAVGEEGLDSAFGCIGIENLDDETLKNPIVQVEALVDYGTFVPIWSKSGNNMRKLLSEARKELSMLRVLFGFYMDRPVNRIGDTGWDWVAGNVCASLKRMG